MTAFFGSRNCGADAEALADVTLLDRLARKVDEGEEVRSFISYSKKIGKFVYKEYCKDRERFRKMARDLLYLKPDIYKLEEDIDLRRKCQEDCVGRLAEPDRQLMVDYYVIGRDRGELAKELGVVLATLRSRIHRLKVRLTKCVDDCRQSPY
jgi:DNA-directed RNA polymerase specialized sigma24 family protein